VPDRSRADWDDEAAADDFDDCQLLPTVLPLFARADLLARNDPLYVLHSPSLQMRFRNGDAGFRVCRSARFYLQMRLYWSAAPCCVSLRFPPAAQEAHDKHTPHPDAPFAI